MPALARSPAIPMTFNACVETKNGVRIGEHPIFLLTSSVLACITTARAPIFGSWAASTIVTWLSVATNAKAESKPTGPAPTTRT